MKGWTVGLSIGFVVLVSMGAWGQAPAATQCTVHTAAPSPAELALSREEYSNAIDLFKAMKAADPDASRAGVVRTLLEQDKVTAAKDEAKAWLAESPKNASALETMAEAQIRDGKMPEALQYLQAAQSVDRCNPRIYLFAGSIAEMMGDFATAKKQIEQANRLAPNDLEIHREWLGTLPRSRRLELEAALLKDGSSLNEGSKKRLAESLEHAQDYKKGDCRQIAPAGGAGVGSVTLPMKAIMDGPNDREGLALDVMFNGKKRRLEIDTGASGILLSRAASSGLNLVREQRLETGGVGDEGTTASSVAHVASIKIGEMEFENCAVELLEKKSRLEIDGLIGGDFFRKYLIALDFPGLQMRLTPLPKRPEDAAKSEAPTATAPGAVADAEDEDDPETPVWRNRYVAPEMQDWTKVYRIGHDLLIPVGIGKDLKTMASNQTLFLIDTGAGLMSISPRAAREVTKVYGGSAMRVEGISGEVNKVFDTSDFTLAFAHLAQRVDTMTAFDFTNISHSEGVEVSGFLGAPILNRMVLKIDYRDNLVKFEYDPKKDPALALHVQQF